jgi:hypothetical protein
MSRILELLVSRVRVWWRGGNTEDEGPQPRYGQSVSYVACHSCGEGSLVYDEAEEASVCNVCGAVDDGPR